jgi:hypothetical protein
MGIYFAEQVDVDQKILSDPQPAKRKRQGTVL